MKKFLFLLQFLLLSAGLFAQTKIITGTVTDAETGEPIVGASVRVADTKRGTVADEKGNFKLQLPASSTGMLLITGVGYKTAEIKAQDGVVHVKLVAVNKLLNDVVVVGYGTKKRSDITGAVVSVPKARLSDLPVTNVLQSLEGAVAGLNITTTSSVPGSSPSIVSRGNNSINAGSSPYIVIDGIPVIQTAGGNYNNINPNDIASIEVLKDASATAIYGVKGSSGVILITTKRGVTGKPVIRYNAYGGVEELAHILRPRSGPDYVQKYADYMKQTGQPQTNPVPNYGELANYNAGKTTDWLSVASQQGIITDHNLSISGGTQDIKYFVSGEYMNQKGVVKGYQYHRASIRSNLDINVTNFLTVGMSSFFASNNYDGGRANLLFATAMSPYGTVYNADRTYAIYPMYPELLYTNPMLGLTTDRISRTYNFNGNAYAEVKFSGKLKGLKYRLNAGYIYFPERYANYTGRAANDLIGTASITNAHTNNYTIENIITYTKDWKKNHVDFTGLYSSQERNYITTTAGASGFINDIISFNNLGAGATQTSSSYSDRYGANSQMGRINYAYDGKYLFTATARRDGASVFGGNADKYGVFPSVAFGWNVTREKFMRNVSFVDNMKLRVSYGKTGNEGVGVYQTITTDNAVRYPFNGLSTIGVTAGNLGNANLHWENTKTLNIGLDFAVLKNRINGTVDFYNSNTYDLLLRRSLPIITGYSSVWDNMGQLSNQGIELSLNTQNVVTKDFKWETSIVFAANKNKIIDLYGDKKDDLGNRWFIGHPINVVYDYVMQGIWQVGQDPSTQDPGSKPGDLKFKDLNGDGKIDGTNDRTIIGQTVPKWTGGLTNTFHYKNFNLNIFIQTAQGMTKGNPDLNYNDETGRRNTPAEVGYWTSTNNNNTRPALSYNNTRGYGYASDASYTRIKDVTLSYVFPQKMMDRAHLGSCTIYLSGRNLYTFTKWIGWDPENNYSYRGSGDWTNNYPLTRSFVFGANISLK
ncbi:TonB-dependent receptor SusC precursor [mine drainage metagenome]|uniref:TonB-dependent receptor SusC n=1 Tax=mine drainage metagenome TaxID=410659 RepID=A0A1J5TLM3_9ZZZZ